MTKAQAVAHYGSESALARALGISASAVNVMTAIPRLRQFQLEAITDGKLKADRSPIPQRRHKAGAGRPRRAMSPSASPQATKPPSAPAQDLLALPATWWKTEQGIEEAGRALGVKAQPGDSWSAYRRRIEASLVKNTR
jgi:DNA-binding transcriptional regulator Cro